MVGNSNTWQRVLSVTVSIVRDGLDETFGKLTTVGVSVFDQVGLSGFRLLSLITVS